MRKDASDYKYWAYSTDSSLFTFAVMSNENGGTTVGYKKENQVDGKWVYTISFSTDKTGGGKVYISYYGKNKDWLGEDILTPKSSIDRAGYTFSNSQGIISWAVKGAGTIGGDTLYSYQNVMGPYTHGKFVGDKYSIPEKVSTVAKYKDKSGNLLGTVTITGIAGQKYTAPIQGTYLENKSIDSNQIGFKKNGNSMEGILSDYQLGIVKISDSTGTTYEAVPGTLEDYYDVLPPVKGDYTWEPSAKLKPENEVHPQNISNGVVKVMNKTYGKPVYIGINETKYRYLGDFNKESYYERNPFSGGSPAPWYVFNTIDNVTKDTSQTVTFEGAGENTPAQDVQNNY